MRKRILILFAAVSAARSQPVVAPTEPQQLSTRGEDAGNYNVTNSSEAGYRFTQVGGDRGMFRSAENYGNGIRLFNSAVTVNSKDGHGRFFDEIVANTFGLGNDPYQTASLRVQKNQLYRYDGSWRLSDYFNPGLVISDAQHLRDTRRQFQDHDLRLLPKSPLSFRLGYSRNTETGPALTTEQGLDQSVSVLPIFTDVRRDWNEYRLGGDLDIAGIRLSILRQWDFFKDDTPYAAITPNATTVSNFRRAEPYHGSNPGWFGNLNATRKLFALNGRMSWVMGRRDFVQDEFSSGRNGRGVVQNLQTLVTGDARRPFAAGDFSISLFPGKKLTVVNNVSAQNNRIDGDATLVQVNGATAARTTLNFNYLGIRTVAESLDVDYRFTNWLAAQAGYLYSSRLIRTVEGTQGSFAGGGGGGPFPGAPGGGAPGGPGPGGPGPGGFPSGPFSRRTVDENENHLNSGRLGLRLQPLQPVTLSVDGEVGRNNNPFTPISDRDYHAINGRADYRVKNLRLSTGYRQFYNTNSPAVFAMYSSHSRQYSANASWTLRSRITVDAAYTKLHMDSASAVALFLTSGQRNPPVQRGFDSLFRSNIHSVNFGTKFALGRRADVYAGYNLAKDVGGSRANSLAVLSSVQTFPLSYQAPLMRLSIRMRQKLSWNAGWQFYRYSQEYALLTYTPNYRAHVGYTSLSWSF